MLLRYIMHIIILCSFGMDVQQLWLIRRLVLL